MRKSQELLQLEVCNRRGIKLNKKLTSRLYSLSRGFEGEQVVYEWFKKYSRQNFHMINDYWFNHGKNMQIDLLIIMNNHWIVVEVKNYHGLFEYRNNECYLNDKLMSDNHFHQLSHRTQRLQHIASELSQHIKVESVMIFIDEHCELSIQSDVQIKLVQRNQLKSYIESISQNTLLENHGPTPNQIKKHLDKYRVDSPFQPIILSDQQVKSEIRKGVDCAQCQSFNTAIAHRLITCQDCGQKEYKSFAIQRAALDLRYMYYYHPEKVTTHAVYELCGSAIQKRSISKTLLTKYKLVENGPKSYYKIQVQD